MEEHRQFDNAIERYEIFNRGRYNHDKHVAHVREVMLAGHHLMRALGVLTEPTTGTPPNASLEEAALWALNYFVSYDEANAQVHCAPVRYSPITFRLAYALRDAWPADQLVTDELARVLAHVGAYNPDTGR